MKLHFILTSVPLAIITGGVCGDGIPAAAADEDVDALGAAERRRQNEGHGREADRR